MEKDLKQYRKDCEEKILAIHGIDLSGCAIDEEQLENAMAQGVQPIDVAIGFDPNNYLEEE